VLHPSVKAKIVQDWNDLDERNLEVRVALSPEIGQDLILLQHSYSFPSRKSFTEKLVIDALTHYREEIETLRAEMEADKTN
jgi:hypothetical protein